MKAVGDEVLKSTLKTFAFVLLLIIGFAVLSQFVGILGQVLYAIVAALFYFVPNKLIERDNETFVEYGLVFGDWKKGILWGLGATLITLPFFFGGFWFWQTQVREQRFSFDADNYRQWSATLEGKPKDWGKESGVWVWSDNEKLFVGLRNKKSPTNRVLLSSKKPFKILKRGAIIANPSEGGKKWILGLSHKDSQGVLTLLDAEDIDIKIEAIREGENAWPMYEGPAASSTKNFSGKRGYLWLLLWAATQFLLIAFPEEYFYRGYLQTRFARAFKAPHDRSKWWVVSPAIVLTSFLFGIGHLLVPVGGVLIASRMSVFFPALIFGWLREKTDSILAPVIYHACCNLMVLVSALHFG